MAYIKTEIKEETPDEMFENGIYSDASVVSHAVKSEFNELDNYEYEQPEEYSMLHGEEDSSTSDDFNAKHAPKRKHIECENVYIDGEPEVCITNFNGLMQNRSKEDASDPLALHITPVERPIQERARQEPSKPSNYEQPKRICIVSTKRAPPVKDLVNRTYSSKYRKLKAGTRYSCETCKKLFSDVNQLRNHEHFCISKQNKCRNCNLIFQRTEYLMEHVKKCPKVANEPGKPTPNASVQSQLYKISHRSSKSCNICLVELGSEDELAKHKKENHFVANAYACHMCDSKFDTEQDALLHLRNTH